MHGAVLASDTGSAEPLDLTVEHGQRAVFCGLTSIVWLHRKIQDAFFLVVGSRTCAHLIQSAAGVMIFAEPRFATAVLEDRDLAGMADCVEEVERVIGQVIKRRPNLKTIFLVGSCPSEVIKLDLDNIARKFKERHKGQLRVVAYSGSGIETTFTQGEDSCLSNLVPDMPQASEQDQKLLIVGSLPDIVEDQFARLFAEMGITNVEFFPGRQSEYLPGVGPGTRILLAQPYLGDTARALISRGATLLKAPYPYGAQGTLEWFRAAALSFDIAVERFQDCTRAPFERAKRSLEVYKTELAGRRVAFLPDSQLEIPLARFLARECGMHPTEVATPFYDATTMSSETPLLPSGVQWYEGQNLDSSLERVRNSRPDLTVCGLGIANPLEAEGLRTKWSIELMFSPIQGFDQAGDLAELFARPLRRKSRLEVGAWN